MTMVDRKVLIDEELAARVTRILINGIKFHKYKKTSNNVIIKFPKTHKEREYIEKGKYFFHDPKKKIKI